MPGAGSAALGEADVEYHEDPPAYDPPVSPDSTGVFSTVADALRAWTTEPLSGDQRPGQPSTSTSKGEAASAPATADAARLKEPEYDVVRQTPRFDLAARRIAVTIDQEPAHLVDLSEGGAQVVTAAMLKPGRQVRLSFPSAGPLATAKAKIVWSRLEPPTQGGGELQYRAGVTFLKLDPKIVERVVKAADHAPKDAKRHQR